MPLRKPKKSEWRAYCDRLSKNLANIRSEPVTASLVVNHHGVAEWVPLLGITYEPKQDLFEIMLQDLEHWVHLGTTSCVVIGTTMLRRSSAATSPTTIVAGLSIGWLPSSASVARISV